jgi:hypothetical protein
MHGAPEMEGISEQRVWLCMPNRNVRPFERCLGIIFVLIYRGKGLMKWSFQLAGIDMVIPAWSG